MIKQIECLCGNKDQSKFFAQTKCIGFKKVAGETREIKQLKGFMCGNCGRIHNAL